MPIIETIEHDGKSYPKYQSNGNATRFYTPFALEVCKGLGVDVGSSANFDWMFNSENQIERSNENIFKNLLKNDREIDIGDVSKNETYVFPIDPLLNGYTATRFPEWCTNLDFIYSSNCLEHIPNYIEVLDYWRSRMKYDGVLFMALPHPDQSYHRPESNRKHIHLFHPKDMVECLKYLGFRKIFCSERDLYHGFSLFCNNNYDRNNHFKNT